MTAGADLSRSLQRRRGVSAGCLASYVQALRNQCFSTDALSLPFLVFITQHSIRDTIRSVINLEACGVGGPEIVFQVASHLLNVSFSLMKDS